jgi:hypothetical protein
MRRSAALALVGAALAAAPAGAVELEGSWYVLVHYQDKESPKPDAWRWEDRVWKFEKKGDRLEWTEYPIVVFDDEKGRFENLGRMGHESRVAGAWEPSPAQLADVKDGLQVNSLGVKTKSLRAKDGGAAWSSNEGASSTSASVITYTEHWSVEGLPDRPVFSRDDSMGSSSAEEMSGRTEYRTAEVVDGGEELHGSFDRDGTRIGNFRMIRSGQTEAVKGSGLTQGQRAMQMFARQAGLDLSAEQIKALTSGKLAPGAPVPEDVRAGVRAEIRRSVEEAFRQQSTDPRTASAQVDGLTRKIEHLILDEGKSPEEVQEMLKRGEITP